MRTSFSILASALLIFLAEKTFADSSPVCVRAHEAKAYTLEQLKKPAASKSKKRKTADAPVQPVLFPKYSPLRWTGKREGRWMEVQTIDNLTYYVRRRDLSFDLTCLIVLVNKSVMYTGPGPTFEKVDVAEKGMVFRDLGGEDGWTQVENRDGKKGWINLDHTWKPAAVLRMKFSPEK